jgi:hypothetical protein
MICSPTRAALIVTAGLAIIFLIALIASLARPPSKCTSDQTAAVGTATTTPSQTIGNKTFPWSNIRLPTDVVPLTYDLFVHPNLTTFTFVGSVSITLDVRKDTNFFLFHSKNLTISSYELYKWQPITQTQSDKLAISKLLENKAHEQIYIETWNGLSKEEQYVLRLQFNGSISDSLAGFYRSAYETPDKKKQ